MLNYSFHKCFTIIYLISVDCTPLVVILIKNSMKFAKGLKNHIANSFLPLFFDLGQFYIDFYLFFLTYF